MFPGAALAKTLGTAANWKDMLELPPARYEFRIFTRHGSDLVERLRNLRGGERETDGGRQTYILAPSREHIGVKLRGGRLEVKEMIGTDGRLQLWRYRYLGALPVTAAELREHVFEPLGVAATLDVDAVVSGEEILQIARALSPPLVLVELEKDRTKWPLGPCNVEYAHVHSGPMRATTVALESRDRQALLDLISELGLNAYDNESYSSFLLAAA